MKESQAGVRGPLPSAAEIVVANYEFAQQLLRLEKDVTCAGSRLSRHPRPRSKPVSVEATKQWTPYATWG